MKLTQAAIDLASELKEADSAYDVAQQAMYDAEEEQAEVHARTPKVYFSYIDTLAIPADLLAHLQTNGVSYVYDLLIAIGDTEDEYDLTDDEITLLRGLLEPLDDSEMAEE